MLEWKWVQRRLPPEKREQIEKNFHDRGIMVLLGARLLPGIRTPIFIMAGMLRVPLSRFLLADALYAIPGVNLLFWLAYMLTDQVVEGYKRVEEYRPLVMVVLAMVFGVVLYRYVLTKRVSTGEPPPPIIAKPAEAVVHAVEAAVEKVAHTIHPHHDKPPESAPDREAKPTAGEPVPAERSEAASSPPGQPQ